MDAVKEAMSWHEEKSLHKKQRKYYPDLKKSIPSFPLIFEIQDILEKEWAKPDKKINIHNRASKLYPLNARDAAL